MSESEWNVRRTRDWDIPDLAAVTEAKDVGCDNWVMNLRVP
jgi:hypothetical protein